MIVTNSSRGRISLMMAGAAGGAIAALAASRPAGAQDYESFNVSMYANLPLSAFTPEPFGGNDCWGYVSDSGREYALMGLSNQVAVVEVTDPALPVIVGAVTHDESLWADVKVYQDYAYVSNEAGGGIDIIDLSGVDGGTVQLVRRYTGSSIRTAHNVAINEDSGYLYLCGANINGGSLVALDLNDTPDNPVVAGFMRGPYVHDAEIVNHHSGREIAFVAAGSSGLEIWDVTDKAAMVRLSSVQYSGLAYCHQCWLSEDEQYLFVNDELDELFGFVGNTRTLVFDVSDLANPEHVADFPSLIPATDHNLYVNGPFVYEANYTSGLRIFDATDPLGAFEVAYFDTFPEGNYPGFDGAWSCYPFFPSGTILVSDVTRGLFVLGASVSPGEGGLDFAYPEGQPTTLNPGGGDELLVEIIETGTTYELDSAKLFVDTGAGFVERDMDDLPDLRAEGTFPPSSCGEIVRYYVSAMGADGREYTSPANAPGEAFEVVSIGDRILVFEDDFQTEEGWLVRNQNLSQGSWERATPDGNGGLRGDPPTDYDGSGRCFITGNDMDEDVDGGPTILESPEFTAPTADTTVSYAAWFTSAEGVTDQLITQVSNDGGGDWVTVSALDPFSGWTIRGFIIGDYIEPTDEMQVRFVVSDGDSDSITEAAIDAFQVIVPVCGFELTADPMPVRRGRSLTLTAVGATPDTLVYFFSTFAGTGATNVPQLNVTLDLAAPLRWERDLSDDFGVAVFTTPIPSGAPRRDIWFQAAENGRTTNVIETEITN